MDPRILWNRPRCAERPSFATAPGRCYSLRGRSSRWPRAGHGMVWQQSEVLEAISVMKRVQGPGLNLIRMWTAFQKSSLTFVQDGPGPAGIKDWTHISGNIITQVVWGGTGILSDVPVFDCPSSFKLRVTWSSWMSLKNENPHDHEQSSLLGLFALSPIPG